jgi:hypothetical protein
MLLSFDDSQRLQASNLFTDSEGRPVYYPLGRFGRGRILPGTAAAENLLNQINKGGLIIGLVAISVIVGSFAFGNWTLLAAALACTPPAIYLHLFWKLRGLPLSDEPIDRDLARWRRRNALSKSTLLRTIVLNSALLYTVATPGPVLPAWVHCGFITCLGFSLLWCCVRLVRKQYRDAPTA